MRVGRIISENLKRNINNKNINNLSTQNNQSSQSSESNKDSQNNESNKPKSVLDKDKEMINRMKDRYTGQEEIEEGGFMHITMT